MTQDAPLDQKALEARLASIRNFVSGALADVKIASALPMVANEYDFDSAVGSLTNAHIELGMLADALFSSVPAAGAELDSKALKAAIAAVPGAPGLLANTPSRVPDGVIHIIRAYHAASPQSRREGLSYTRIIEIVNDCTERMKRGGESHRMLARWISENIHAALAAAPSIPRNTVYRIGSFASPSVKP